MCTLKVESMKDNITELNNIVLDPKKLKPLRGTVSREHIGRQIGVGGSQIANYENGERKPSADKLLRLMMLYGVKPDDISTVEIAK